MSHSTKKPWRQKGTGRARAGMTSSPLWRGGGRIFPNKPDENFTQKLNRKMYRAGMASILSQLAREDRLVGRRRLHARRAEDQDCSRSKCKRMGYRRVLILTDELDENLYLSARNLPNVHGAGSAPRDPGQPDALREVLMTKAAVKHLEECPGMNTRQEQESSV